MSRQLSKHSQKFSQRWLYYSTTKERIKLMHFSSHLRYLSY